MRIEIEAATAATLRWLSNEPATMAIILFLTVYASEGTEWVVVA